MNYKNIATTIFTPLEYGCIGYSEEEAIKKYGAENIKIYNSAFKPLEWSLNEENEHTAYTKIIIDLKDNNRVIGMHLLSPNAGEIIQGFSVAFNLGVTKDQLDDTVAIHPTVAEELVLLKNDKQSGGDGKKTECWG